MNAKKTSEDSTIAVNRRARHEYHLEDSFEAGLVLEGWEVKSLRAGRIQLNESYVLIKNSEAWLFGCHITPLAAASTHIQPDITRTRKLLLNKRELNKLIGHVERKGYTVIPTKMYWKNNRVKIAIALARGKKEYDKRESSKAQDWQRTRERLLKRG